MDALGISMGGGLGILAGTEVAQKISDNILAGNFKSAFESGDSHTSLMISGFTKFFIIMAGYSTSTTQNGVFRLADTMCTVISSSANIRFHTFGYWNEGNLYSYNNSQITATLIAIE